MPELHIDALTLGKLAILLLAVSLHESAHAFVADVLGDSTARRLGRVTLKPWRHLDPIMSVLLPGILLLTHAPFIFGAGKPVPVVMENLRHPERGFALVAVAGPLSNIVQAALFSVGRVYLGGELGSADTWTVLLNFGITINLLLAFFNLIPVPPLDGSRLVAYLLPTPIQRLWYRLDPIGMLIIIALFFTGVLQMIMSATFRPAWLWWTDMVHHWV